MRIPILRYENILLTAIQSDLTDRDALDLQADLMQAIEERQPRGVVIDIGAVSEMDSYLIMVIRQTAEMAALLGSESVVCGIQPSVALMMTELTSGIPQFRTMLTLDDGVRYFHRLSEGEH